MILQVLCLQILHRLKKERVKNGSQMASKAYSHSFRIFALQYASKDAVDNIEALHMNIFHFITANLTCLG